MIRTVINILSPIAALAVVWVSLQSFVFAAEDAEPVAPLLVPPTSLVAQDLLPELGSISQILATTASNTAGESVPESVTRLLAGNGAVLLVPQEAGGGL
jgi:hypothetical protein